MANDARIICHEVGPRNAIGASTGLVRRLKNPIRMGDLAGRRRLSADADKLTTRRNCNRPATSGGQGAAVAAVIQEEFAVLRPRRPGDRADRVVTSRNSYARRGTAVVLGAASLFIAGPGAPDTLDPTPG